MDATSRRSSEATFEWSGRGGVVKKFLDHTTPSARTNDASRLLLIVQPPLLRLRRGFVKTDLNSHQSPGTLTPSWFALKPHSQSGP